MIINFNSNKKISVKDRLAIASILKEAFWGKLEWYFSRVDKEEALLLFEKAITYNMGYYYKEDDIVLGAVLLGKQGMPHLTIDSNIRKRIGFFKGWLLKIVFTISPLKKGDLCLQMISVSSAARGKGIGKKLLGYLDKFAEKEGFKQIVLDVIDNNIGALKLYEREGYLVTKHMNTKIFTHGMGFDGVYIMKKQMI
jgi:ribosomal protein S18 acetylase RimI-like enzyme